MQEMYQEGLKPEEYDNVHSKHEDRLSERFRLLRSSVESPEAFSKAVEGFQKMDPKTQPS
jgi:hypothetical protein